MSFHEITTSAKSVHFAVQVSGTKDTETRGCVSRVYKRRRSGRSTHA
jgi:hypothetical protein